MQIYWRYRHQRVRDVVWNIRHAELILKRFTVNDLGRSPVCPLSHGCQGVLLPALSMQRLFIVLLAMTAIGWLSRQRL